MSWNVMGYDNGPTALQNLRALQLLSQILPKIKVVYTHFETLDVALLIIKHYSKCFDV